MKTVDHDRKKALIGDDETYKVIERFSTALNKRNREAKYAAEMYPTRSDAREAAIQGLNQQCLAYLEDALSVLKKNPA
ncbi:MAG: hypothetical protein ACLPY5_15595 [Candidatus Bathyarchaeia archaeon]